ncbi:protein DpdJ [Caballeronia sp. LjRoot34]|uniref:protein DpdJ n=1 Tax=Caballeronia sp. LjRoot34 TaxID=3342325 RepID=UPI003ED0D0CF
MENARNTFLQGVLDAVEAREAKLLGWGIVDGHFRQDEFVDLIDMHIEASLTTGFDEFLSADDVIEAMLHLQWITAVELDDGTVNYRSRMAETVRLLSRLRQLFPKHAGDFGWQQAPTLVADFRFLRRQRQYPRRDISVEDALDVLQSSTASATLLKAARVLIASNHSKFQLSGFQVRAAERIIRGIETGKPLATIVCAGTGSGKTLAFYLPALASIARHLLAEQSPKPWVKTIALYPRVELLKDQLREVLKRSLALSQELTLERGVPIRVGAYFGDTPNSARECYWPKVGDDYICTSLSCLNCGSSLRWKEQDRKVGREHLSCSTCDFEIDGDTFPLTRDAIEKRPPDVLFTTTEMLNQRLSDNAACHLFGVGPSALHPPELVLVDEVHAYEGRHGAQVSYLMRRWQRLLDQRLRFVGLSATLREASSFFVSLTGCQPNLIEEVSPLPKEIEFEGAEYLIALRGDPVSRAALLSTTIQTTMLLQRCLDPKAASAALSTSAGVFGQKTFVFTDNLDVINRLYFDLLSAEGRNSAGNPDMSRSPNGGLAHLRKRGTSNYRFVNGQDWRVCESLHGDLKRRLDVKRVSSQDRGVSSSADVIVATAVLEVGFDDPSVGAMVQHKAPRSIASFLQRKGRAGRSRGMRPWTAIVLSDYGRDRTAYQSYDLLFDPELPVRTLPVANRYLMRMQAVFATIDYLGTRLQDAPSGSVWLELSGKAGNPSRRKRLQREIQSILESDSGTRRLATYLEQALKVSSDDVSALLWEFPRPLMTTVLPTALRRLNTQWTANGKIGEDYVVSNNPLPDFIPASLFADLNLAEVVIDLPDANLKNTFDRPTMSIFAALREFAPGRVTRRYGIRHKSERHWIAPSLDFEGDVHMGGAIDSDLDITSFGTHILLGRYQIRRSEKDETIAVYRPTSLQPKAPPKNVKDSSNASMHWHTQLVPNADPVWMSPPTGGVWRDLIGKVGFFTHAQHAPVEVRRFATSVSAEIGVDKDKVRADARFTLNDDAVGVGASYGADGIVFQLRIPENLAGRNGNQSDVKWRALRSARFTDNAWRGHTLRMVDNPFAREWLVQIYLSAVTYVAINEGKSLEEADRALSLGTSSITLVQVLDMLFQSQVVETQDDSHSQAPQDKLRLELDAYLHQTAVLTELHSGARVLWEPIDEGWEPWLRGVYQSTVAAAILRSVTDLCPTIDPNDMNVDLSRGPEDGASDYAPDNESSEIWLTEKTPGGSGLVEQIMRQYSEDPRRFFSVVRANLQMSEFETIDYQMVNLLTLLTQGNDSPVVELIREFRATTSHSGMTRIVAKLRHALVNEGFSPFHGFMVSMGNRILRQGAGPATDRYLASVLARWRDEEGRLGIEIDLRVISHFLSQSDEIDQIVPEAGGAIGTDRGAWRTSAIYGLLWARGKAVRQTSLELRNPFAELPSIERLLVVETIADDRIHVSVATEDWLIIAAEHLSAGRLVTLTCGESQKSLLGDALNTLVTNPIDSGYLRPYARLQGIRQSAGRLEVDVELIEALQ